MITRIIVNTDRVSKMSKQKKVEGYSAPENVLQRIREMESILDEATQKMDALEKKMTIMPWMRRADSRKN